MVVKTIVGQVAESFLPTRVDGVTLPSHLDEPAVGCLTDHSHRHPLPDGLCGGIAAICTNQAPVNTSPVGWAKKD